VSHPDRILQMQDLKARTIRGGIARLLAQGAGFVLRIGSVMVLARLLGPKDFGLVGMVTAFTGVLGLLRDFGLSAAAIQRKTVTEEQISTLFWINILLGVLLGLVALAMAPAIAAFYHEPELFAVTAVLAAGFIFNAAGTQHSALLVRQMRFTTLSVISVVSGAAGTAIAICGAEAGYGYWALVAMTVASPLVATVGVWLATAWVPGMPHRRAGIRSMMHFGGALTFTGLVVYIGYNAEKVLIGRFWGADAIGIYGRAYQLVNIPTDNLNSSVGEVAFSALSRLQDDPLRLKNYFIKGFSVVLGLTVPITIGCMLFADDIVFVLLGPKWTEAAPIVRLLAPTVAIFAIINPLGWMMFAVGFAARGVKAAPVVATIVISGCVIGLPYGPKGVAFAYSAVLTLWLIPHILWSVHGTPISLWDVLVTASRPMVSGIVAGAFAFGVRHMCGPFISPLPRLMLESCVLLVAFFGVLLFVAGQKSLYLDLLKGLKAASVRATPAPPLAHSDPEAVR
jgi:O-antigen/teichoic acid export membrane protein